MVRRVISLWFSALIHPTTFSALTLMSCWARSHTHTHTHPETHMHGHETITVHAWPYSCSDRYTWAFIRTHMCSYIPLIRHTHPGTRARARPHIQTHTQTHTHTQYLLALRVHYSHCESWHLYCSSSLSVVIDQNIQEVYVQSRPLL